MIEQVSESAAAEVPIYIQRWRVADQLVRAMQIFAIPSSALSSTPT